MRILAQDTGALVIDYQVKLIPAIKDSDKIVHRTRILLAGLKALGVPMVFTEQYKKGLGATIPEITEIAGDVTAIEKLTFSCCETQGLFSAVQELGRKNIIVCGVEAHVCVLQTVIDLAALGYVPVWVHDCVGSRNDVDKAIAQKRAEQEGALITTSEAILFELTRKAGSDTFKAISKLVK